MSEPVALVQAALRTHQGRVRRNNQDYVASREPAGPEEAAQNGWLYILADGAGGMDAGEIASQFATERVLQYYFSTDEPDWGQRLQDALLAANADLRALGARHNGGSRMATTLVATVVHGQEVDIANVGDSRAYHFRRGVLRQVTRDQSLVAKLVEDGAITPAEAAVHPRRNVLLYSIGSDRAPRVDLYKLPLEADDLLLLCSDGLTRHVTNEEIGQILGRLADPAGAAEALIELANERGGQDNISVVLLRYTPERVPGKVVAVAKQVASTPAGARGGLWFYTALLSLVQTVLIFLVWYSLRF